MPGAEWREAYLTFEFRDTVLSTWTSTPRRTSTASATLTSSTPSTSRWSPGDQEDGKVLYLGPDRAGNLLEVVSVRRDDGTEIVIHAMWMRKMYELFLNAMGEADD